MIYFLKNNFFPACIICDYAPGSCNMGNETGKSLPLNRSRVLKRNVFNVFLCRYRLRGLLLSRYFLWEQKLMTDSYKPIV